jgi:hypothetical protein
MDNTEQYAQTNWSRKLEYLQQSRPSITYLMDAYRHLNFLNTLVNRPNVPQFILDAITYYNTVRTMYSETELLDELERSAIQVAQGSVAFQPYIDIYITELESRGVPSFVMTNLINQVSQKKNLFEEREILEQKIRDYDFKISIADDAEYQHTLIQQQNQLIERLQRINWFIQQFFIFPVESRFTTHHPLSDPVNLPPMIHAFSGVRLPRQPRLSAPVVLRTSQHLQDLEEELDEPEPLPRFRRRSRRSL